VVAHKANVDYAGKGDLARGGSRFLAHFVCGCSKRAQLPIQSTEVVPPRRGERDAQCVVSVAFSNPVHDAMNPFAVVEERELLVVGTEVGEADAEESDGDAARSCVVEEIANHG